MVSTRQTDAVILCGGLGTRLREVTGEAPKVMAEVKGGPFLNLILDDLKQQGIRRVVLCTGYKADVVEEYYRQNDRGLTIAFSRESEPLGTGGALKYAQSLIDSDPFLVLNGDSFCSVDLNELVKRHREQKALATIVVNQLESGSDVGTVQCDALGAITAFVEKGQTRQCDDWINAGIYCLCKDVFQHMPEEEVFSIEREMFPALIGRGLMSFQTQAGFMDIGTPQRWKQAKETFQGES